MYIMWWRKRQLNKNVNISFQPKLIYQTENKTFKIVSICNNTVLPWTITESLWRVHGPNYEWIPSNGMVPLFVLSGGLLFSFTIECLALLIHDTAK